ncbi:DUF397 domain-containing protein [Streptomyces sp. NBC_01803]|uniref:DUF397 domain-containing protein n=1 Tax=Streptomyces sp. NBC_01803 TaxID=2975946 RepID=UPI002DDA99FC|nr:DUF397 domain-containing protein [Streptomyces sp. NBC_01803]WSA45670.1 DUF397 domain-containing protein [Streptomyces sp. NBC_01803]
MTDSRWQKSSLSTGNPNQNCLEVATAPDSRHIRLRESTSPATILTTTPTRWAALLRHLKAGDA